MRLAMLSTLFAVLVGCGAATPPARSSNPPPAATPRLAAERVYRIDHDVEERVDERLARVDHVRALLWVREERPDGGFDAIASLTRQEEGTEGVARALVALQLGPDGSLQRDPDLLCVHGGDELFAARFLRHVVVPYPQGGELFVAQREQPLRARVESRGRQLRARAELALDEEEVALLRARGVMRVRTHADMSERDPLAFDIRTRIDGSPVARDPFEAGATARARTIRIDEHTRSTRLEGAPPAPASCEDVEGGDFDVRVVIQLIRTRQHAIRACYERQLRQDRALQGRIKVTMTIGVDGHVGQVGVTENTMGPSGDEVGRCVVRVIEGFRFHPGPEGGSVTYQFPFVFEPQDPPRGESAP